MREEPICNTPADCIGCPYEDDCPYGESEDEVFLTSDDLDEWIDHDYPGAEWTIQDGRVIILKLPETASPTETKEGDEK